MISWQEGFFKRRFKYRWLKKVISGYTFSKNWDINIYLCNIWNISMRISLFPFLKLTQKHLSINASCTSFSRIFTHLNQTSLWWVERAFFEKQGRNKLYWKYREKYCTLILPNFCIFRANFRIFSIFVSFCKFSLFSPSHKTADQLSSENREAIRYCLPQWRGQTRAETARRGKMRSVPAR